MTLDVLHYIYIYDFSCSRCEKNPGLTSTAQAAVKKTSVKAGTNIILTRLIGNCLYPSFKTMVNPLQLLQAIVTHPGFRGSGPGVGLQGQDLPFVVVCVDEIGIERCKTMVGVGGNTEEIQIMQVSRQNARW